LSNAAIPGVTPGDYCRLEEQSFARSAGQHFRTFGDCLSDDPFDIGGLAFVDDRPHLNLLVEGVPNVKRLGLSHKGFDISVNNAIEDRANGRDRRADDYLQIVLRVVPAEGGPMARYGRLLTDAQ
jgi:hypothetical protein